MSAPGSYSIWISSRRRTQNHKSRFQTRVWEVVSHPQSRGPFRQAVVAIAIPNISKVC